MIPYIYIPTFKLLGILPVQPFGILVGIGLVVGYMLGRRRARLTGLNGDTCADGMVWIVVTGFIVAHLVSIVFYFPERILERPWVLLFFWEGLSSFGGFIGAVLGAMLYFRRRGHSVLEYVDAIIFGGLPGWVFGRTGCAVVHDHPGKITNFRFAVTCKTGPCKRPWRVGLTRHDLGLYEMVYSVFLTTVLYALKGVRPFYGFHPAVMLLLYAPVRFCLDYLRIDDKHYAGFTPGQYLAVAIFLFGVAMVVNGLRLRKQGIAPHLTTLGEHLKPSKDKKARAK